MPRWQRLGRDLAAIRRFVAPLERPDVEPPLPPPLPSGRMVELPGRGETLVREAVGAGGEAPVLLLHGWALAADLNWFRAYETVAAHGRVLAMDIRGHGRGLRSEQPFTLDAAADDAAALLRHLGGAPATVVGYSMGGSIALLLARRHPECVAGLVLESTALQWRTDAWERLLWAGMASVELGLRLEVPQGLVERYVREAVRQAPELQPYLGWLKAEARRGDASDIAAAGRALSTFDGRPFAAHLRVPTAVIVSAQDRLIRPFRQRELLRAIPGAEAVELDAAHNGWLVRPGEVAAALDRALSLVTGSAVANVG